MGADKYGGDGTEMKRHRGSRSKAPMLVGAKARRIRKIITATLQGMYDLENES